MEEACPFPVRIAVHRRARIGFSLPRSSRAFARVRASASFDHTKPYEGALQPTFGIERIESEMYFSKFSCGEGQIYSGPLFSA
jgi:hypothetical protein